MRIILIGIVLAVLLGLAGYFFFVQKDAGQTILQEEMKKEAEEAIQETGEEKQEVLSEASKEGVALPPEPFQGVWKLSKILISSGHKTEYGYWDEEPLTVDRKSYLVFLEDRVCQSKVILESEAICHYGYGSFNGKAIDVPYYNPFSAAEDILVLSGNVFLKNGQLELHTETGKGGEAILRHIYTKTTFRAEPSQDTPLSKEEMNRRAALFQKSAAAILANFTSWKTTMEEEAAIWGVTFSSDHTPRLYDIPLEAFYHHLHLWTEWGQKALDTGEYRAAHRFAVRAEESFLIFVGLAPEWREVYQRTPPSM